MGHLSVFQGAGRVGVRRSGQRVARWGCGASNAGEICLKPRPDPTTGRKPLIPAAAADTPPPPYEHTPLFPLGADRTPYRKLGTDGVRLERAGKRELVVIAREALRMLAEAAFTDINH